MSVDSLIGRKVGMTRVYDVKGAVVPVTVVQAGPCAVTQVKTTETDGYHAVQLGFEDIKAKFSNFPLIGHAAKAGHGCRIVRDTLRNFALRSTSATGERLANMTSEAYRWTSTCRPSKTTCRRLSPAALRTSISLRAGSSIRDPSSRRKLNEPARSFHSIRIPIHSPLR